MSVLTEKWAPVLDLQGCPAITDSHKRMVTAQLLENEIRSLNEEAAKSGERIMLSEAAAPTMVGGAELAKGQQGLDPGRMMGYDPVLISLVRRAMPQLIAFDVCGVQPMTMPTGLIFCLKSRYGNPGTPGQAKPTDQEALFQEANTAWSGKGEHSASNWADSVDAQGKLDPATWKTGTAMTTAEAEALGSASGSAWQEMAFSIERTSVIAQSRALKSSYSYELAQDLKAVHGLDAEQELSNILATEILSEINREIIRTIYVMAKPGCQSGTASKGVFDLDIDSDGRWSAEKYKGLMMRIEREANAIAQDTRRGRGNFIICSADVASALQMAGMLDYAPALSNKLAVDESQNTFAGVLNGRYKVYVDPYQSNQADNQFFVVGYKGSNAYDAGLFYAPYVPLQLYKALDPKTMTPRIAFKTRYALAANPMVQTDAGLVEGGAFNLAYIANKNYYFRKCVCRHL